LLTPGSGVVLLSGEPTNGGTALSSHKAVKKESAAGFGWRF